MTEYVRFTDTDLNDRVRATVRQGMSWQYEFAAHDDKGDEIDIEAPAVFQIWDGYRNLLYTFTDTDDALTLGATTATVDVGPEVTSQLVPATYPFDVLAMSGDDPVVVGGGWLTISPKRSVLS